MRLVFYNTVTKRMNTFQGVEEFKQDSTEYKIYTKKKYIGLGKSTYILQEIEESNGITQDKS